MFLDTLVFEQQFFRVEIVGKLFFIFDEIMNPVVTELADVQLPTSHLFFAEAFDVPLFCVDGSGNEMMFC